MLERVDRLASGLVIATWGLLVLGAAVRVHGAGLACPDWPLCFGEVVPRLDFEVAFEFGHRVVAGAISLAFLGLGALLFRQRAGAPLAVWGLAAVVLAVQIVLGGLTVLELLAEWTVTSHLLTGNTFCLLLLVLTLLLRERRIPVLRSAVPATYRAASLTFALLVAVQLGLGGFVASSYAGLACGTWPTCDGVSFAPTFSGAVGLQVVHRLVGYGLLAIALGGAVGSRGVPRIGARWSLVLLAVTVQAGIGIANVLLRLPVEVTLLHSAGAAAVVLGTTWLVWDTLRAPVAVQHRTSSPVLVEAR